MIGRTVEMLLANSDIVFPPEFGADTVLRDEAFDYRFQAFGLALSGISDRAFPEFLCSNDENPTPQSFILGFLQWRSTCRELGQLLEELPAPTLSIQRRLLEQDPVNWLESVNSLKGQVHAFMLPMPPQPLSHLPYSGTRASCGIGTRQL